MRSVIAAIVSIFDDIESGVAEVINNIPVAIVTIVAGLGLMLRLYVILREWYRRKQTGADAVQGIAETVLSALGSTGMVVTVLAAVSISITMGDRLPGVEARIDMLEATVSSYNFEVITSTRTTEAAVAEIAREVRSERQLVFYREIEEAIASSADGGSLGDSVQAVIRKHFAGLIPWEDGRRLYVLVQDQPFDRIPAEGVVLVPGVTVQR